jgi:cullin 3
LASIELLLSWFIIVSVIGKIEISEKISKLITIFRYLQDKDVFESFYKNFLAKRLLDSRRILEDAEKEVIKKLIVKENHRLIIIFELGTAVIY